MSSGRLLLPKSTKHQNYKEQCYQQIDKPISNCSNNGINIISSMKTVGENDPISQMILQDRRHRNLLASKKYRAKRQKIEREKSEKIQSLSDENQSLQQRLQELEFENKSLKEIMNKLTTSSAVSILDRERLCSRKSI